MASKKNIGRRNQAPVVVTSASGDERALSNLIGSLIFFGLAWGGLAIGYASAVMAWLGTSILIATGVALMSSAVWNLIKENPQRLPANRPHHPRKMHAR